LLVESITIDGQGEEDFRRSIEAMLRRGQADAAAEKLRALIEPYAGSILPARFRSITSADVRLTGWRDLAHRIGEHDRPGHRISAVEITAGTADPQRGRPGPHLATRYFSDEAYPFSEASRRDLLHGYGAGGGVWQGHPEGGDTALSIEGIADLYDAVERLEAQLMDSPEPDEDHIRAGSLGACYLAVLIHQAVEDAIDRGGLPRPLCVLAGTGEVYPYFDAPVVSGPECREAGLGTSVSIALPPTLAEASMVEEEEAEEEEEYDDALATEGEHAGRVQSYGSLLSLGASIRAKKPVITVDPTEAAAASHHYEVGAQHRLTIAGNAERVGVLPDLAPELAPDLDPNLDCAEEPCPTFAAAESEWQNPLTAGIAERIDGWNQPAPEAPLRPPPLPHPEAAAPDEPVDMPVPVDTEEFALAQAESAFTVDDFVPEEAASPPPQPRTVIPPPASHSLRSRVVQRESERVTPAGRVLGWLSGFAGWLRGFRR
jgi:hypothetical protein